MLSRSRKLPARTAACALGLVAVTTIDWLISSGKEGHLCLVATAGAGYAVHLARLALARSAVATPAISPTAGLLASCPTGRAACWRVGQAATGKKLLLARGKRELLTTVATIQNSILKCHVSFLFSRANTCPTTILRVARGLQEISHSEYQCTIQRYTL